jgi:uncharacterized protein YecE (DUF72 family)
MQQPIRVGTSGWHYAHWRGPFYPEKMRADQMLAYCVERFNSLEINNSFYRLPSRETFTSWRDATPDDFLFAVKASRFITHNKKLKDPQSSIERFFASVSALEPKIGAILFQLPPQWGRNLERLEECLEAVPKGYRYAFEFRNDSWFGEETYTILRRHNAAFCVWDLAGTQSPRVVTADYAYIRLHGPDQHKYSGSYSHEQLFDWLQYARDCQANGAKRVFIYFDNDQAGHAALNAMTLRQMISGAPKKSSASVRQPHNRRSHPAPRLRTNPS